MRTLLFALNSMHINHLKTGTTDSGGRHTPRDCPKDCNDSQSYISSFKTQRLTKSLGKSRCNRRTYTSHHFQSTAKRKAKILYMVSFLLSNHKICIRDTFFVQKQARFYKRGSTGSLSKASTPNEHSCTL